MLHMYVNQRINGFHLSHSHLTLRTQQCNAIKIKSWNTRSKETKNNHCWFENVYVTKQRTKQWRTNLGLLPKISIDATVSISLIYTNAHVGFNRSRDLILHDL